MKAESIQLCAAAALGALAVMALQVAIAPRVTSEESHAVWNYIEDAGVKPEMEARFNRVNSDWPPTKAEMGMVLLEARVAVAAKSQTTR